MPSYIIHNDGAYNVFSTISDGCHYVSALTLDQVCEVMDIQPNSERLSRAHANGCSGIGWTLDDCIAGNRAGEREATLTRDEFIRRFLTLPA